MCPKTEKARTNINIRSFLVKKIMTIFLFLACFIPAWASPNLTFEFKNTEAIRNYVKLYQKELQDNFERHGA